MRTHVALNVCASYHSTAGQTYPKAEPLLGSGQESLHPAGTAAEAGVAAAVEGDKKMGRALAGAEGAGAFFLSASTGLGGLAASG